MRSASEMKLKNDAKFKILFLDLPESDLFEVEGILDDTRGGDAHTEDVLLRRQVIGLCYSVYVRQVAVRYIFYVKYYLLKYSNTSFATHCAVGLLRVLEMIKEMISLLFGRICELIFSPSVIAFHDATIVPQVLDGLYVGALERCDSLKVDGSHEFCLILTVRILV